MTFTETDSCATREGSRIFFMKVRFEMPRRNNRKVYSTGKAAVFFGDGSDAGYRQGCIGCAFVGYGGVCTTSDGICLKKIPARREPNNHAVCKR